MKLGYVESINAVIGVLLDPTFASDLDAQLQEVESAARLLESQGVEIVGSASTSAEALRLARALEPDVVLVDVELGDEDGVELARALEARAPSTRAILISAHDRDELGLLANGVEFLPKGSLGAAAIQKLL